jgi:hypothetical protein
MNSIIIFELPDGTIDWRTGGQTLPRGAVVREVTVSRGDGAETLELHDDCVVRQRVVDCRNAAIDALTVAGSW